MVSRVMLGCAVLAVAGAPMWAGGESFVRGGRLAGLVLLAAICARAAVRWVRTHGPRVAVGALLGYICGPHVGVAPLAAVLAGAVVGYWLVPGRRVRAPRWPAALLPTAMT